MAVNTGVLWQIVLDWISYLDDITAIAVQYMGKYKPVGNLMGNDQDIGGIIRFHRKKAGLTQVGLGDLAGVGKTAVFDIENNKQSVQCDTLKKVLQALNIKMMLQSPLMDAYRKTVDEKS
jgi:HTH-type transcriptional regulator/antitoxin HipB